MKILAIQFVTSGTQGGAVQESQHCSLGTMLARSTEARVLLERIWWLGMLREWKERPKIKVGRTFATNAAVKCNVRWTSASSMASSGCISLSWMMRHGAHSKP